MSQQLPPDRNTNIGPQILGVILGMFLGSIICYASRIYTRVVPTNKLELPDYVISLAVILEIPILVLIGVTVSEGLGKYSYYISSEDTMSIIRQLFITGQIGVWVAFLVRASVALMLIQFDIGYLWRLLLYIAICIQIAIPFSLSIAMFAQCRPLNAIWEPVNGATCWTKQEGNIFYYYGICAAAASDIVFAVMPVFLIWSLKRPLLERMIIIILMALGLSATGTVIARAIVHADRSPSKDLMRKVALQVILCRLEDCLLIMAACLPFLKRPIGHYLHQKFGLPRFWNQDIELNSFHSAVNQPGWTRSGPAQRQLG